MGEVGIIAHDGVFQLIAFDVYNGQVGTLGYWQTFDIFDLKHASETHQRLSYSLDSSDFAYQEVASVLVLFDKGVQIALAAAQVFKNDIF